MRASWPHVVLHLLSALIGHHRPLLMLRGGTARAELLLLVMAMSARADQGMNQHQLALAARLTPVLTCHVEHPKQRAPIFRHLLLETPPLGAHVHAHRPSLVTVKHALALLD